MRRATLNDADGIRRLTKQLVDYRRKAFNEERFMFGLKKRTKPDSERHHFFVCIIDNNVVGMTLAELLPTDRTEAYLNTLFVDKAYQKLGVGKRIFEFIMQYLKDLGIETVIINVRKNEPMEIGFFEKYGFKTDFELKPFTSMVKKLI